MKLPLFLLIANALIAQDAAKPQTAPAAATTVDATNKTVMNIDPKARANDYVQAFDFLRKNNPTLKIMVRTSQTSIVGITDLTASASGTLLMIKTLSNQGTKTQFIPIEQIMEINYSP
jgi:hypothetical protein